MSEPFERTFTVTIRGSVKGRPVPWGTDEHEKAWLEEALHKTVSEAIARYYQCKLTETTIEVELKA